ncbi:hypothetical protein ACQ4PT_013702 [Festuca glaucescens]
MAPGEGGENRRGRRRWLPAACLPRPGCFTVSGADEGPSGSGADEGSRRAPTHLVVTVNGIVGRPELKKISFVAHSLGGLIARYAIALLYENDIAAQTDCNEECEKDVNDARRNQPTGRGKIAGLEPMNFITFATPHFGTRSHKQMPLLRGSYRLEKMAFRMSWIAGRSGKHLFLKDIEDEKPPLLLQMVTDYGDLHFISALRCFKRRVVYSNVCGDFVVGWRTSSIRRQHELPKKQDFVDDGKYPHVVYVEKPKAQDVDFSDAMIYQAKTTTEMEEVMLKSLNRIPWERVDVSFKKSRQRILAHSTIQREQLEAMNKEDELDDDEALKLGIATSEMQAMAEWQGMSVKLRESALAAGGPAVAPQTPPRQPAPTLQR